MSNQKPVEMRELFKQLERESRRKSLARRSIKDLESLRDSLLASINDLAKYLGIPCSENDVKCIESSARELSKSIAKSVDLSIVDSVKSAIDVLKDLDPKDWDIIKQLIDYTIMGSPAITRHLAIGYRHRALRDHITDQISKRVGEHGKLVEYGFIERTPLVLYDHRWVRLNYLSSKLFDIAETILKFRDTYIALRKLQLLHNLLDMVEYYNDVIDVLSRKQLKMQ